MTVKLECTSCHRNWYGPGEKVGSKHAECKGTEGKGTWQLSLEESKPKTTNPLLKKVPAKKPVQQRLPNGPDAMERFKTEVTKQNQFISNWHALVWNKLNMKGWAVAAVEGYRDVFVDLVPNYCERLYTVLESRLAQEVHEGIAFVVDPVGVIEILLHQLSRHPAENVSPQLVEHLLEAQHLLVQMKDGFTPPTKWTQHSEVDTTSVPFLELKETEV